MLRVAQLDSAALDDEVRSIFWRDFQTNLPITRNKEEYQLLLESLVFLFSSKLLAGSFTNTYGSRLSGVSYTCKRRTLYLITTLSGYLESKLSHFVFSSSNRIVTNNSDKLRKAFSYLTTVYSFFDVFLFAKFLSNLSSTYLSPLHRLLGVSFSGSDSSASTFHDNTVYSQIEFQNRQLLWNAILELFNVTLLSNAKWFHRHYSSSSSTDQKHSVASSDDAHCPYCNQFPTNPYVISCCNSTFCYLCVVKVLEWSHCPRCDATANIKASPLY
ncbi:hypothetical protein HG535_0A01390 [Zygotorulaspora mrakii]|uniref:RING-type domain-containing protein n=1 Tax=Zygotorulaspora mrakii TaxID=42260 RepID=A0A7H9AVI4_ZYGMR|nr:uncharacterized protein HG535_0A01390 [Zygotorulaspora mrakii]QLG70201.1 hypothetical protein HG535_0A01390 [Zygotorulaspora mrakii]